MIRCSTVAREPPLPWVKQVPTDEQPMETTDSARKRGYSGSSSWPRMGLDLNGDGIAPDYVSENDGPHV
jgi:hypothetical protein